MSFFRRLGYMYASAGRLLDFSGSYNRVCLKNRLEIPGYLRDREAFLADRDALQRDVNQAKERLEHVYGRSY